MTKYLYHGSQNGLITVLEPRISLEFTKHVYATDDYRYALVRAGKQMDCIREEYYGHDKPFELAECCKGAFEKMFDCSGYVYLLDPKDFYQDPNTGEYKSDEPVIPVDRIKVDNLLYLMRRINVDGDFYDFHWFYDEEYWNNVREGLDGFLQRKIANKKKLNEILKGEAV